MKTIKVPSQLAILIALNGCAKGHWNPGKCLVEELPKERLSQSKHAPKRIGPFKGAEEVVLYGAVLFHRNPLAAKPPSKLPKWLPETGA